MLSQNGGSGGGDQTALAATPPPPPPAPPRRRPPRPPPVPPPPPRPARSRRRQPCLRPFGRHLPRQPVGEPAVPQPRQGEAERQADDAADGVHPEVVGRRHDHHERDRRVQQPQRLHPHRAGQ